jgi:two-component system OmpR family response regulator
MPKTIAVVEDEADQRDNYVDALSRRGYRVQALSGRDEALAAFSRELPDMAILDIMLGEDMDGGFDLCRELLLRNPELPIIFLTSRADDIDRISGLRMGAWDYQAKPVSLSYLAERVGSLFRIMEMKAGATDQARVVGDLVLDEQRLEVRWQGHPLALTYTEFRLLQAIIEGSDGRGASYQELVDATRQGVVENNTINTHVLHLRRKFCQLDAGFDRIRSVYGYGYRWG